MVLALVGSARGTEQDPSVARSIESGDARLSGAADTHGAHELLGWSAKHDLAAGLSRAVEWHLKENGRLAAP
jgi:nucleoside-diphosphate-sugar epimerase